VGQPRWLGWHTLVTLSEILSGLALGVLLGVVLALCMMISPRLQRWLMPLVLTSQAIPVFALAPLLVLWFGFGMSAKVMMAVLVIFFPVTSAFLTACGGSTTTISIWRARWAPPQARSCDMSA
jgi:putative hydroxymethylpyrimidine transport system permease protein